SYQKNLPADPDDPYEFPPTFDRFHAFGPQHSDEDGLTALRKLGYNCVRLCVYFESLEPERGVLNQAVLDDIISFCRTAERLDMYVIVDAHQDLYSRRLCGSGYADHALPPAVRDRLMKGDYCYKGRPSDHLLMPGGDWGTRAMSDVEQKEVWEHFYGGESDHHCETFGRLVHALTMARCRAVIGYDIINEPGLPLVYHLKFLYRFDLVRRYRARLTRFYERAILTIDSAYEGALADMDVGREGEREREGEVESGAEENWEGEGEVKPGNAAGPPPPVPLFFVEPFNFDVSQVFPGVHIGLDRLSLPQPLLARTVYAAHLYQPVPLLRPDPDPLMSNHCRDALTAGCACVFVGEFGDLSFSSGKRAPLALMHNQLAMYSAYHIPWAVWEVNCAGTFPWNDEDMTVLDSKLKPTFIQTRCFSPALNPQLWPRAKVIPRILGGPGEYRLVFRATALCPEGRGLPHPAMQGLLLRTSYPQHPADSGPDRDANVMEQGEAVAVLPVDSRGMHLRLTGALLSRTLPPRTTVPVARAGNACGFCLWVFAKSTRREEMREVAKIVERLGGVLGVVQGRDIVVE
ncbi:hypothetical protein KIPB_003623, partial [Kipferlia bialata]